MKNNGINLVSKDDMVIAFTSTNKNDLEKYVIDSYYRRIMELTGYNNIITINAVIPPSTFYALSFNDYYKTLKDIADSYWPNSVILLSGEDTAVRKDIRDNCFVDIAAAIHSEKPMYMLTKSSDVQCLALDTRAKAYEIMEYLCVDEDPEDEDIGEFLKCMVDWFTSEEDKDRAIEYMIGVLENMNLSKGEEK